MKRKSAASGIDREIRSYGIGRRVGFRRAAALFAVLMVAVYIQVGSGSASSKSPSSLEALAQASNESPEPGPDWTH